MEEYRNARLGRLFLAAFKDCREDLRPPNVVGRVDVEEFGPAPGCRDFSDDAIDVGLSGFAVQVDSEDVPARPGKSDRARLAEARRGAEHESPPRRRFRCQSGGNLSTGLDASQSPPRNPIGRGQSHQSRSLASLGMTMEAEGLGM